jgi:hypothetical protein
VGKSKDVDADNVVSLNKRRPPSRKGKPLTDKQKASLARGTQLKKDKGVPPSERGPSRWQQLLAGDITVEDLELDELQRMQCHDRQGNFAGKAPAIPAKLAREMKGELLRRGQALIDSAYPEAVKYLTTCLSDTSVRAGDRLKAAQLLIERGAGRMPETVRVEKAATWDETFEDGVVVITDRDKETG